MILSTRFDILHMYMNYMNKKLRAIHLLATLVGVCFCSSVAAVTLDSIKTSSMPGERVQIKLELSEALSSEPLTFSVDNPARVVIDLPNTSLNLNEKSQTIGIGMANSLNAIEAKGRSRVVINLTRSVSYSIDVSGNTVILSLGSGASVAKSDSQTGSYSEAPKETSSSLSSIKSIDFRRGEKGEGRIIVELSNPMIPIDMRTEGGNVVIDFIGAQLPSELDRKLDVIDFATPVKEIDTAASGSNTKMVISAVNEDFDHLAYQSDENYTIEFKPLSKEEKEKLIKEKIGYTGERLSLNFQDIEVRAVLQ